MPRVEEETRKLLIDGSKELGLELSDLQADLCLLYLSELKKWNRKINLTSIRTDRAVIIKHFLDSFSYMRGIGIGQGSELLDMGSGAGFPALPLKIVRPELGVVMVESTGKKASFLRHIIRTLDLKNSEVVDERIEKLPDLYAEKFDVVTARAFASIERALSAGYRFLKRGGLMVLSRGPEEGIDGNIIEKSGFTIARTEMLTLPYSGDHRSIQVFRKKENADVPHGTSESSY